MLNERSWVIEDLAERFGVSKRTIRRNLQDIQDEPLQFPVVSRRV